MLSVSMLSVVMLSISMLSVVMLSISMLSVSILNIVVPSAYLWELFWSCNQTCDRFVEQLSWASRRQQSVTKFVVHYLINETTCFKKHKQLFE